MTAFSEVELGDALQARWDAIIDEAPPESALVNDSTDRAICLDILRGECLEWLDEHRVLREVSS